MRVMHEKAYFWNSDVLYVGQREIILRGWEVEKRRSRVGKVRQTRSHASLISLIIPRMQHCTVTRFCTWLHSVSPPSQRIHIPFGQLGRSDGWLRVCELHVCVCECVCACLRPCTCSQRVHLHACVPACHACVFVRKWRAGVGRNGGGLLLEGVKSMMGGALIWLGVKKCPQVSWWRRQVLALRPPQSQLAISFLSSCTRIRTMNLPRLVIHQFHSPHQHTHAFQ